jgi:hypothetical protein
MSGVVSTGTNSLKETKCHANNACNDTAQSRTGIMRCLQPTMHGSTVCHVEHSCIADCRAVHGMESSASIRRHKPLTASDLLLQFLHPLMQKSICTIIDAICCCQHLGDLSMTELRELLLQLCNLVFKEQVLHPGKAFQFSLMIRHYMLDDLTQQLSRCPRHFTACITASGTHAHHVSTFNLQGIACIKDASLEPHLWTVWPVEA